MPLNMLQVFFLNYSLKIAQLKRPIFLMFLKSEPKGERISGTMSKLEERLRFQNHAVHVTASFYPKGGWLHVKYNKNALTALLLKAISLLLREDLHICSV